jgi:hypothetical protein
MFKRGQVTIFIIIALVIVGAVLLFFFLRQKVDVSGGLPSAEEDPEKFLEVCVNQELEKIVDQISRQGGSYDLSANNTLKMRLDNREFLILCYTTNFYASCINQKPMLLNHIKSEIKTHVKERVDNCLDQLDSALKEEAYNVELRKGDFNVSLARNRVILDYDISFSAEKAGKTLSIEDFRSVLRYPLYDLAVVAQEIVSQEAEYCNFEYIGFMQLYPEFRIDKFKTGNGENVYTVTHKLSGKEFKFGVLGCVFPPGI